jgi:hypothetical protein
MKYLIILSLLVMGCAESNVSSKGEPSEHPVYDYAGPHAKASICAKFDLVGDACETYYWENFKQQLLLYYGGTDSLFHVCEDGDFRCTEELRMEAWFRNLRSFAKDTWGWPCGETPEC